jgi:AcrR family transcriptional regulator
MVEYSERQLHIMNKAIELIGEKSIQELTVRNLAKKLGVTDGAIYRHFESKTDILLAILKLFQERARENMEKTCFSSAPSVTKIEKLFTNNFKYFSEFPSVAAVIFSVSIFQNDSVLSKEVYRLLSMQEEALSCVIKKGQESGEICTMIPEKELIRIIIGSMRYIVTKWRLSNYSFDLISEGNLMLSCLNRLLIPITPTNQEGP